MEWKNPQLSSKKKFKSQPSAGKLMFTVVWDSQGPVLEHYQVRRTTINSAHYSEMLTEEDFCRMAIKCTCIIHNGF
jgi:hypothetical protein